MEMKSLEALADEITSETIHTGEDTVEITKYRIRFEPADPPRLENSELKGSYTKKPLVNVDGESLFGELAILRVLQKDGWDGVWMASTFFHGKKVNKLGKK